MNQMLNLTLLTFLLFKKLRFFMRMGSLLYSSLFYSFGKNSYIHLNCVLDNPQLVSIGSCCYIKSNCWLNCSSSLNKQNHLSLLIGNNVYIGRDCQINAWSRIIIEDNVMIADRVLITDADHTYSDTHVPIKNQPIYSKGEILISEGCWIGVNSVIMPNVRIGKNAVVGANSVVTRDVPDFTVVAGAPAKIIKPSIQK